MTATAKTALPTIVAKALVVGIEASCVITVPGDTAGYANVVGPLAASGHLVKQRAPLGSGRMCAWVVDAAPFRHLVEPTGTLVGGTRLCGRVCAQPRATACAVSTGRHDGQ